MVAKASIIKNYAQLIELEANVVRMEELIADKEK